MKIAIKEENELNYEVININSGQFNNLTEDKKYIKASKYNAIFQNIASFIYNELRYGNKANILTDK